MPRCSALRNRDRGLQHSPAPTTPGDPVNADTTSGTLRFHVLGSLEVHDDHGELVGVRGMRRRALLLRLLIDANRVVPSDALIEDVWSGRPPSDALGTLQSHISLLRRVLGQRLHSRRPGYLLTVGESELDARLFEVEVAEARGRLEGADPVRAASVLVGALDRWRGRALLDVAGLPWALPTAVHLEQLRMNAVELAAEALLLANRVDEAVAMSRAAVEEEPLRERLWTHLMVGLARQGRQAEALRAYQRVRHHLAEQLGIEPSPALLALEDAILMQRPIGAVWQPSASVPGEPVVQVTIQEDDEPGPVGEPAPSRGEPAAIDSGGVVELDIAMEVGEAPDPGARRRDAARVHGRGPELARLRAVINAVATTRSLRTLVVTGAPGMGRSRFSLETLRLATAAHFRALPARFGPPEAGLGDPFDRLLSELQPTAPVVGDHAARDRALFQALHEAASAGPLCVVITELQFATADDLLALRGLLRSVHELPVLVVLSAIDLEFQQNRGVASLLWELHRRGAADWIRLEALDASALRELAADLNGTEMSETEAQHLHDATGGNPLLTVEALRWERGESLALEDLATLFVEQFVAAAGGEAIDAASTVAVYGGWVSVELVAELLSRPVPEVLAALDNAARVGLLQDSGRGSYRASASIVANLLVNRVSQTRRAMLHREIASRLPGFADEQGVGVALAVANHWLSGARSQDSLRVYEAARDAATFAIDHGDHERAMPWLGIAQRLSEADVGVTVAERAEMLYLLLETRTRLGYPIPSSLWRSALTAARVARDPVLEAKVVLCQVWWPWATSAATHTFDLTTVEGVLERLPAENVTLRARLLAGLALALRWAGLSGVSHGARVSELAWEALACLEPTSEPAAVYGVTAGAVLALQAPTTVGRRLAALHRAGALADSTGEPEKGADLLLVELATAVEVADGRRARAALAQVAALGEATASYSVRWRATVAKTRWAVLTGAYDEAAMLLQQVRELDPTPERSVNPLAYLTLSSPLYRQLGDARLWRATVEAMYLSLPDLVAVVAERASCAAHLGELSLAQELAARALQAASDPSEDPGWLSARLFAADVAAVAEDEALAARLVPALTPFHAQVDAGAMLLSRMAGGVAEHLGALHGLLGDFGTAGMFFTEAVEIARELGSPYYEARAELRWARLLHRRAGPGDVARAEAHLHAVLDLSEHRPRWALRTVAETMLG